MISPETAARLTVQIIAYAVCWALTYIILHSVSALIGQELNHGLDDVTAVSFVAFLLWRVWV